MHQEWRMFFMGKNYFTEEQRKKLLENHYIEKVSEKAITYTKEFKEIFAEEYHLEKCHRRF